MSAIVNNSKDSALSLHLAMHQEKSENKFDKYNIESFIATLTEQVPNVNTREDSKKLRLKR